MGETSCAPLASADCAREYRVLRDSHRVPHADSGRGTGRARCRLKSCYHTRTGIVLGCSPIIVLSTHWNFPLLASRSLTSDGKTWRGISLLAGTGPTLIILVLIGFRFAAPPSLAAQHGKFKEGSPRNTRNTYLAESVHVRGKSSVRKY